MLSVHFWISISSDHCVLLNTPRTWTLCVFLVIHVSFPTISIDNCEYTYHQVWVSFTFIYFHIWILQSFIELVLRFTERNTVISVSEVHSPWQTVWRWQQMLIQVMRFSQCDFVGIRQHSSEVLLSTLDPTWCHN